MLAKAGDFCHSGRKIRVTSHRVFGSGFPGSDAASRNSPQLQKGFIALHILGAPVDIFRQLRKPLAFVDIAHIIGFSVIAPRAMFPVGSAGALFSTPIEV